LTNFYFSSLTLADPGRPAASIECRASGSPAPDVFWELDGTRMTEALPYKNTLRLRKEGIYKCIAESRAGSSIQSLLVFDAQMNSERVPPIVRKTVAYVEDGFTGMVHQILNKKNIHFFFENFEIC
jgi:hypothetical protein